MKTPTILAHWVPDEEAWFAHQSAAVLKKFGIVLVILATERHVDIFLREAFGDTRCKVRRLQ